MKYTVHLSLTALLVPAAAKIYTGFNYGAFWSEQSNVKRYADFHQGFELAKNLTNTPVPFDSARLYTCITTGTQSDPTEAFQAAIDTGTNLLLGMWISPGATSQSNDVQVENELAALGKGFEQHGQKLADLIIGLSVGNEDIYRFNNAAVGVGSDDLLLTIEKVRKTIAESSWARYMEGKPIGHTDTAQYAVVSGSDFIGMTGYPYWNKESIENANVSFMSLLKDTERRAGNIPVWISEMGWPINGTQQGEAVASAENYQRYWNEVGCEVFGRYNTFWFELLQDSQPNQPDWGLLDTKTHQPRIRDLTCGGWSNVTAPAAAGIPINANATASRPQPTTFSTVYLAGLASVSAKPLSNSPVTPTRSLHTTHTTKTLTTTITPSSISTADDEDIVTLFTTIYVSPTPSLVPNDGVGGSTDGDGKFSVCITMMDLLGDGVFIPVATYASDMSDCSPPPQFTGSPFTMIAGPTTASAMLSDRTSLFDLYAPSTGPPSPITAQTLTTTAPEVNGPTCVRSAGVIIDAACDSIGSSVEPDRICFVCHRIFIFVFFSNFSGNAISIHAIDSFDGGFISAYLAISIYASSFAAHSVNLVILLLSLTGFVNVPSSTHLTITPFYTSTKHELSFSDNHSPNEYQARLYKRQWKALDPHHRLNRRSAYFESPSCVFSNCTTPLRRTPHPQRLPRRTQIHDLGCARSTPYTAITSLLAAQYIHSPS